MIRPSAAFLDRDGTIIRDRPYLSDPADVELLPRVPAAIARLNARSIPVVVVTNQSGIGRGLYSEADFHSVQREVDRCLAMSGCAVDGVYYCPHAPEERCACRKPSLHLFEEACRSLGGFSLSDAFFVGDKVCDVFPAVQSGGRGFLVRTGAEIDPRSVPVGCDVVQDLWEAVDRVFEWDDGS